MGAASDTDHSIRIEEIHEATDEVVDMLQDLSDHLTRSSSIPTAQDAAEIVASPATRLLVARTPDGAIAGVLTLAIYRLPSGRRAWIEDVVVSPDQTRKGIAKSLVQEGLRLAAQGGASHVELVVDPAQKAARHLFQRIGFGPYEKDTYRISVTAGS